MHKMGRHIKNIPANGKGGIMDHKQLDAFRNMVGLSQPAMAKLLGYGVRNYQMMESGEVAIRNGVGLSCAAYALGIVEYDGPAAMAQWKRRKERK